MVMGIATQLYSIHLFNKMKATKYNTKTTTKLESQIQKCSEVDVDCLWAILKYREIGILRKVLCICNLLKLNSDEILPEIPQDENGRFLDKPTRAMIHDALIRRIS